MMLSTPAHKQTDPAKLPGQIVNPVKSNVPTKVVVPVTHAVAAAALLAQSSLPVGHDMMDDMLTHSENSR